MEPINSVKFQENHVLEGIKSPGTSGEVKQEHGETVQKAKGNTNAEVARQSLESREKMARIAEAMDNYVKSMDHDLDIRVHEKTGRFMVKVLSHETGKVIREIPPEELLNLASRMEEMAGLLFSRSV